jgi:hypothetical protein
MTCFLAMAEITSSPSTTATGCGGATFTLSGCSLMAGSGNMPVSAGHGP